MSYAVWRYYRFNLSHRDIEDLLAERGIIVTGDSIFSISGGTWCELSPVGISRGVRLQNGEMRSLEVLAYGLLP